MTLNAIRRHWRRREQQQLIGLHLYLWQIPHQCNSELDCSDQLLSALKSTRLKQQGQRSGNDNIGGRSSCWLSCTTLLVSASSLSTSSSGTAAVSWPACQVWVQDGGEQEALMALSCYIWRETMSTCPHDRV